MDVAEYTPQELARLQLGWMVRENPGESRGTGGVSSHKRDIRQGQQQARQEMLRDVGVA